MSSPPNPASGAMHCANPTCRRELSGPRESQILEFEIVSIAVAASDEEANSWDESPKREAKRVYLCSECARSASIQIGAEGIIVRPDSRHE